MLMVLQNVYFSISLEEKVLETDAYKDPVLLSRPSINQSNVSSSFLLDAPTLPVLALDKNHSIPSIVQTGKPYLILHIGPSKTGTTTIQKDSVRFQSAGILQQDQYVYLGRYAPQSLRLPAKIAHLFKHDDCLQQAELVVAPMDDPPKCWKERFEGIQNLYHSHNISIVISDEAYSYDRLYNIMQNDTMYLPTILYALADDWNIQVVITYRRYAEWLLSAAKEYNHKLCHDGNTPEGQWNGTKCPSIWQLVKPYRIKTDGGALGYRNWDTTIPVWRQHGITVRIINLHHTNSLTSTFYCDMVPHASNTCKASRNQPVSKENSKSIMRTVYNDIVFDAAQAGLLKDVVGHISRQEFASKVEEEGTKMGLNLTHLPLNCPSRFYLEELLQKSLQMEQRLWGPHNNKNEHEHVHNFWKLADERKEFCSVNTYPLLKGKSSWEQVMESIHHLAGTTNHSSASWNM